MTRFGEDILWEELDSLLSRLSGKEDILAALAVHARATASPSANLTHLRTRMNRIRSRLSPTLDDRSVVLSRSGLGFEKISSRLFSKEIIREGQWIHPRGGKVSFDAARLGEIVSETNRYLESVGRIPMPDGHKFDAAPTLGWVHAVWLDDAPEGVKRIMGLVEVHSEEIARKMGTEIRDVSMMLERSTKDSHGNTFNDVITHVAATPYPVIDVQATFEPLALSTHGVEVPVPVLQEVSLEEDGTVALAIEQKKEEESVATEKTLSALGFAATDEPAPEHVEERVLALAKERDDLFARIEAFEKADKERDEQDLEALVLSTKEKAVSARNPEGFGGDQEERVRRLWTAGDKDTARELCSLYSQPIVFTGDERAAVVPEAAQAARDNLDTAAARYAARGWRVEWSSDRSRFTRRKGDAVVVESLEEAN